MGHGKVEVLDCYDGDGEQGELPSVDLVGSELVHELEGATDLDQEDGGDEPTVS